MAELPRLNNVIRAFEEGKPAFTCFAQAEIETAIAMSTSKFDGIDLRDGAQFLGRAGAARRHAVHAQPPPDRRRAARLRPR